MNFKDEILKYTIEINSYLEKTILDKDVPEIKLIESMKYSLLSKGKRLRPMLMIWTYKIFKEDYTSVIPFALAIEMIHNFSLIHDDLPGIDNDDFRHGKLTNHKMFGESTAILAGDALLNKAYVTISEDLLNENNLNNKVKAFNEFSIAVSNMIIGEYVDTECEGKNIPYELLEYIHQNKTGALLKVSMRIGAILAGANEDEIKNITEYADRIGLAFQIKDDILSEIGDEKKMGKPVGNDKEMNKCTFATIYGVEKSNKILDNLINESIEIAKTFESQSEFFVNFAMFMKNREY